MRVIHPARRTPAPETREVLQRGAGNWAAARARARTTVPWEEWRERGQEIRADAVRHLPELLEQLTERVESAGGAVHRASDAATAREIIAGLCEGPVVKSKSMLTDEIGLDVDAVETDLGEWIIQLLGDRPSHILAPAIHVSAERVAELFSSHSGEAYDAANTRRLVGYARETLRQAFLEARTGITGVNMAVAATGTLILVESEGNIRMCTSLPRRHIAVMGIEKVVRDWDGAAHLMQLLPLAAHGKPAATYTSLVTGVGGDDGPEELHLVLVDDGRSALRGTELESALHCIRCGACLYACPVYRQVGGHAYGAAYAGPIGAVITPALEQSAPPSDELPWLSSLCGACVDACPVGIPLDEHLVALRSHGRQSRSERGFWDAWARLWSKRSSYRALAMTGGKVLRPLWPGSDWTKVSPFGWTPGREAKLPAAEPFHKRWEKRNRAPTPSPLTNHAATPSESDGVAAQFEPTGGVAVRFAEKLAALDGTLHETTDPAQKVRELVGDRTVTAHPLPSLIDAVGPRVDPAEADVSVIHADVAIADTGQVAWAHGPERGRREALLPDRQVVLVKRSDLVASVAEALARWRDDPPTNVVFAAGPSRTADIEQTMMLGVHAPRSLDVVLYG